MGMRQPMQLSDQIEAVHRYLRTARANYNRSWKELSATFRKRRLCPFEQHLRHRRFEEASRLLKLAELCLGELRHQRALVLAPFRPGDQIRVSVTMQGHERAPQRYLVLDVEWCKGDTYVYVVHELTKRGRPHPARYRTWVCPSNLILIEPCAEPIDRETTLIAQGTRERAAAHRAEAIERGNLAMFEEALKRSSPWSA